MVKYTINMLQAMVGAKLTDPIEKIHKRPTFGTLWNLQRQLVDDLQKVAYIKYPFDSYSRYILLKETFGSFSNKEWTDPEKVGEYIEIPAT